MTGTRSASTEKWASTSSRIWAEMAMTRSALSTAARSAQLDTTYPGPKGLEAVKRDHERDVEERAHEKPGQGHIPGMRVYDVGVHAVARHEQVGREGLERRRIAGLAHLSRPRSVPWELSRLASGQPVPRRVAAHVQPRFGPLSVTEAAHLDRGPAGERAAQVLDDHARAAVDVGRVLTREHQHAHGRAPFTRHRHQRSSRHARG